MVKKFVNRNLFKWVLGSVACVVLGMAIGFWFKNIFSISLGNDTVKSEKLFYELDEPAVKVVRVKSDSEQNNLSAAYELQRAFNQIAKDSIKAVVSIQVISEVENPHFSNNELLRRFFGIPENHPRTRKAESFGSGFLINREGYLLSNHHVIENAVEINVIFQDDDKKYTAEVVGTDPDTDIALLKIKEEKTFPFLYLGNSDKVQVGDIMVAIGNPFGLSQTFTTGVVSAKGRTGIVGNAYENFIQTDVAINQGNSGGPLIDLEGKVIGINSAILSRSGGNIGISFSIPINMAKDIVEQLKEKGKVERGWIGVGIDDVGSELANQLGISKEGVAITRVFEDSPASKSDIKPGDILVMFDGKKVRNGADLRGQVARVPLGKKVEIKLIRDGKKITTSLVIEKQKGDLASTDKTGVGIEKSKSYFGIRVSPMTQEQYKSYGVDYPFGVNIVELSSDSPYRAKGGVKGDVLLSINRQRVTNVSDFEKIMNSVDKKSKILLKFQRDKSVHYMVIP